MAQIKKIKKKLFKIKKKQVILLQLIILNSMNLSKININFLKVLMPNIIN